MKNIDWKYLIERRDFRPGGIESEFVKLNKNWALKLFFDDVDECWTAEENRDTHYERHILCHELGYAPDYGSKIDFFYMGEMRYGYLVEVVRCRPCSTDDLNFGELLPAKNKWSRRLRAFREECNRIIDDVYRYTDWYFTDCHEGNWGFKNGRPVIIDFGH